MYISRMCQSSLNIADSEETHFFSTYCCADAYAGEVIYGEVYGFRFRQSKTEA